MAKVENLVTEPIMEFFNSKSFMKVKSDCFSIGRLMLSFGNLDNNKKLVPNSNIDYYLDFKKGDAFVLIQDMITGKLLKDMELEKAERLKKDPESKYAQPVRMYQGGVSAAKAKERGIRTDGAAQARILKIQAGSKYPVMISVEEGQGKETEKGLIVPTYGTNPDTIVRVTLTVDNIKALGLATQAHYNAFLSGQYAVKAFAEEKAKRTKNENNKTD